VTGPVTAVGPTTATVTGSVNPNGSTTTWHVEYGTTTSYGSHTTSQNAGSGTTSVAVSANLSGLKPGTTYHYRLVATNSAGTSRGADAILTTASAPVAVTGSASAITATSAMLNGTVNPDGRDTAWYFEYGTSTSYGTKTPAKDAGAGTNPVAVSASVTGLKTGTLYHFRLVAKSDAGTSLGADATFTPSSAPTVVTRAGASVTDTGAKLSGTVNPNGEATTAYFEYGTSTSYGTKTTSQSVGSGTGSKGVSTSVAGLKPGTVYHFRLVATNAAGTGTGADITFTTSGPPVVITGPASGIGTSVATVTGSVDPDGHSTSWRFEYGTTTGYGATTSTHSSGSAHGAQAVGASLAGLTPGTTYHFRLVAANSSGTVAGADATFTTTGRSVTISASANSVVYGRRVVLSGRIANLQPNQPVGVFARGFGATSFTSIATTLTGTNGAWTLAVRPSIRTTYKATWNGSASTTVTIGVRPAISLRRLPGDRFATHVMPAGRFGGRIVQLQRRRPDGRWFTIARKRLNAFSSAVFHPTLPRGRSTLRVAMSINQAGPGYLGGSSRTVTVRVG
jgi:phosphodiesterase/alkaline phosphatase D-like protein